MVQTWYSMAVALASTIMVANQGSMACAFTATVPNTMMGRSVLPILNRHDPHVLQKKQQSSSYIALFAKSPNFRPIPSEEEGIPIPFVDVDGQSFIECFADSIAEIDGVEYTIGVPCDYAVALCYFTDDEELIPLELDDPKMDAVFSMAESIVEEEFGDELVLQRTPQTLTLVGELEEDEDDEDDEFDLEDEDEEDDDDDEEVEVLLAFEHDNRNYNLVRMLDPMLLVGKADPDDPQRCLLLAPEESDKVMPVLEDMFLEFREDAGEVSP